MSWSNTHGLPFTEAGETVFPTSRLDDALDIPDPSGPESINAVCAFVEDLFVTYFLPNTYR
jgi:hypothetical protein